MRYQLSSMKQLFGIWIYIGFAADPKVTRYGPAIRNQTIIHYCLSGTGYFNQNKISAGQGFIIHPGDHEEYHPDEKDPWAFVWIILSGPNSDSITEFFDEDPVTHLFRYGYVHEMCMIAKELQIRSDEVTQGLESMELLIRILNCHFKDSDNQKAQKNALAYAQYAKNYIDSNYHSKITVSQLTQKLGISQPYLYRIFKEEYQVSPKQYLTNLRVEKAKYYLLNTNMTITQIGHLIGYEDVLAFSSFFADQTNLSPLRFRETGTINKDE